MLFITLDSCRYDTFADLRPENLSRIGPLHRAKAPSTFTFGSHAAMFVGFTPGVFDVREPYVNPKFGRIFKLLARGLSEIRPPWILLEGRNIVQGFKARGYRTVGTGGVNWFNPRTPASQFLIGDFDEYFFAARSVTRQVAFQLERLAAIGGEAPVFAFANIAETHVPYHFEGAPWPVTLNPCRPFADDNDATECRRRQTATLEFVDRELAPLLDAYSDASVVICADHGDAWGEDGLWEHGVFHDKVIEVPLVFRLRPSPVAMPFA
jgi:hypothetical protein